MVVRVSLAWLTYSSSQCGIQGNASGRVGLKLRQAQS